MNRFFFLDYDIQAIEKRNYICIYVLEYNKKCIFKIFKKLDTELKEKLDNLNVFEDISDIIVFAIKRNGKLSLDINIWKEECTYGECYFNFINNRF